MDWIRLLLLMRSLPVGCDGTSTPEDHVGRINYELPRPWKPP